MASDGGAAISAADLRDLVAGLERRLLAELDRAATELAEAPVHQSRVAARRLRSLLSTLRPMLRPTLFARARRDLRNVALELEAIREADVRRNWLLDLAAGSGTLQPGAQRQLLQRLEDERRLARQRFREHAGSVAYGERLQRLRVTLEDPRLVAASGNLRARVGERLQKRWKRLCKRGAALRVDDPASLHALRLAAKHARYASESLMPLLGRDPGPAVKPLKRLQNCLGDHRDATLALAWLRGLGEPLAPVLLPPLKAPVKRVVVRREKELTRLLERLEPPDLGQAAQPRRRPVSPAPRRPAGRSTTSPGPRRRRSPSS